MICCMTCPWVSSLGPPVSPPVSSPSRPRRPVGFVPGTAGLVPGLVAVSSPLDSVAIRRFSSRPQPSLQHGKRRLYTNLRPHTLIRPVAAAPSLPSRRRLSPPHRTLSPPSRRTLVATAAASLPTISSMLSKSAISVANASKNKMADAAGCMADVDSNVQHRQVTLKNHCI